LQEAYRGADGVLNAGSVSSAPYFVYFGRADNRQQRFVMQMLDTVITRPNR
jgi:hypothetical protein